MPIHPDAPSLRMTIVARLSQAPESSISDLNRLTYFRGRVALAAILRGLGVKRGDEVIIQAFTCIAVPEAILSLGAIPFYADVAAGSPNMDPDDLRRKIGPRTRAIVIQHTFGLPADVSRLAAVASAMDIPIVEDCAHTIASRVDGRRVGSFGAAAFYSYEASKPVFIGIGGSAVSNDAALSGVLMRDYERRYVQPSRLVQLQLDAMRLAHRVAYRPSTYWTVRAVFRAVVATGMIRGNYNKVAAVAAPGGSESAAGHVTGSPDFTLRMGDRQSALLRGELADIDRQSAHRRWVAEQYRARINAEDVAHLPLPAGAEPVFGRYPLLADDRPELLARARNAKVELADFYSTPVHPLKGDALRDVAYEPGSCPRAEWIANRIVSLPTGMQVNDAQVRRAVNCLNAYSMESSA